MLICREIAASLPQGLVAPLDDVERNSGDNQAGPAEHGVLPRNQGKAG